MIFLPTLSFTRFVPSGGALQASLKLAMWLFVFFATVGVAIFVIRTVIKYRYSGEIWIRREMDWESNIPQAKRLRGKAAYIKKGGRNIFRIRYGLLPWQLIDIKKLPNPKYMVGNEATFLQFNVGELVQARRKINWDIGGIEIIPVDNTTKDGAKQDLMSYSKILTVSKISTQAMLIGGLVLIFVAGMIVFYFVSRA